jgi:hypothetical protein
MADTKKDGDVSAASPVGTNSVCKTQVLAALARIVDEAYDHGNITKTHNAEEIVYTIRVKHDKTGTKRDLFLFAGNSPA